MRRPLAVRPLAALALAALVLLPSSSVGQPEFLIGRFQSYLNALRLQAGIPGMSAALVLDGRLLWEAGFGRQNVETNQPATPDTPYHIGDLTQMFAATLVLQCVEAGAIRLDEATLMPDQSPQSTERSATVWQLLSHRVGVGYRYDPARFTALTSVVERCSGTSYRERLVAGIIDRLAMTRTVPGRDVTALVPPVFPAERLAGFDAVLRDLARPYAVDGRGRPVPGEYPAGGLDASHGIISTTRDLANFTAALETFVLVGADTLSAAWSPATAPPAPGVAPAPTGLGWFVQVYNGQPVVWHFGYTPGASSALYLRLPNRRLTLILLANSDALSAPYSLSNGDVTTSPFARLFLSLFG
jgi:CubicO group peptidase (beta-lactamase class C family)